MDRLRQGKQSFAAASRAEDNIGTRKVRVKWSSENSGLLAKFNEFRGEEQLVNVTLVCEGGLKLKAHQLLLSACSAVFQDIFVANPCPHPVVILKGVQYEDFAALFDIIYHREAIVPLERLESFLSTAKTFKVKIVIEISSEDIGEVAHCVRGESSGSVRMPPAETWSRNESERGRTLVWPGQPSGDCGRCDAREASVLVEKNVDAKKYVTNDGSSVDRAILVTDEYNVSGVSPVLMLSSASLNEHVVTNADAIGAPSASKFFCGYSGRDAAESVNVSRATEHWKVEPAGTEDVLVCAEVAGLRPLMDEQPQLKDPVDDPLPPGMAVPGPVIVSTAPCLTWYDDDEESSPERDPSTDGAWSSDCTLSEASTSVIPGVASSSSCRPDNEQHPDCAFTEMESETAQPVRGHTFRRNESRVKTEAMGHYPPPRTITSQSFGCAVCSMTFDTESCLRRHEVAHSTNNSHVCHHCGAIFSCKDHLGHHMLVHTVAKPYRCELCSHGFAKKSGLSRHTIACSKKLLRAQGNASPVSVGNVEGGAGKGKEAAHCSSRLSHDSARRGDLEQDVLASSSKRSLRKRREAAAPGKVSTGEERGGSKERFKCSRCEASYARKGNLENHEAVHIAGEPFRCRYCPVAYHRKGYLERHMLKCPKKVR